MRFGRFARVTAVALAASLVAVACGGDDDADEPSGGAGTNAPATAGDNQDSDPTGSVTTDPAGSADDAPAPTSGDAPSAPSAMGGTLTVGIDGEAACYVPHACSVSYGPGHVRMAVLDSLVRAANNSNGYDLLLAEAIEPNEDFTAFTVTLREGVQWSDGTPFTAGDVKTLFDTYVLAEDSVLRGNVAAIVGTEAPDDHTVVFTLAAPQAPFPVTLAQVPIYKPVEGMEQTSLPIGTGPFIMESWETGVRTVLKRNPLYWDTDEAGNQLPYLDEIIVQPITSGDTRINALEAGDIDATMSVDPITVASMRDRVETKEELLNAGDGLFFNNATPPTDDLRVRRGLAFATNKEEMLAAIGGGQVRDQYFVPTSEWYSDEASAATPTFDLEQAQALIDEYVNDPNRSDGQPAGTPLKIDITVLQGAISAESVATVAQQQWAEVGVEVTVTVKDQSTLIGDAISGNFNVNYFSWATPHPYSLLVRNFGPWPETPSNYTHFNSEELFAIVDQMAVAGSEDEMNALIEQANLVIADNVPLIFLVSTPMAWGIGPAVGDFPLLPAVGYPDWARVSAAG